MQLATSSLSQSSTLSIHTQLTEADLGGAAMWVTQRLSARKIREFFSPDGQYQHLKDALEIAVTCALRYLFVEEFEIPYVYAHKRDYMSHFDPNDIRARSELLNLSELWRVYTLGQKYRSLLERRRALKASYDRLNLQDEYLEDEILPQIDSVEMVADTTEWLSMKYKDQKQIESEFRFHDDDEVEVAKKRKMPSRISAYEVTKKSVLSKLAQVGGLHKSHPRTNSSQGFGIESYQVVLNFMSSNHVHFVEDQDLNPMVYAEQFGDPDPTKTQPPEELLRRARMILSTELGKDPLMRNQIRKLFQQEALISVEPTERGITKIDEHHMYFVSSILLGPISIIIYVTELQIPPPQKYPGHVGLLPVS
jgi:transcription elongation factor SPT6